MKKVLIVATVVKKHIMQFHLPTLKMFKEWGWETHVAGGNDYAIPSDCRIPHCDVYHEIDFARFPFHPKNVKAYRELRRIADEGRFDLIHCHTPVGSVLARLASRNARKKGTKVFYTAHGFHFFKGASILNWLIYYPVEWLCSYMTDCIITMNNEDYTRAKARLHARKIEFINGVGVDLSFMKEVEKNKALRTDLGLNDTDVMLLSVGELIDRKNHKTILKAMAKLNRGDVHYVIAGDGEKRDMLEAMAKELGIADKVHFLGYRKDIYSIVKACDIFCFASYQEGLPVALMEAMAGNLPVLASRIRGNTDLIDEGKGGFLYDCDDAEGFSEGIKFLCENKDVAERLAEYNEEKIKLYDVDTVCAQLKKIYEENGVEL